MSDSVWPHRRQPTRLPRPWDFLGKNMEWVAIPFSNAWSEKWKLLSRVRLFATPWTVAYQASPSMGFPRQKYWSGVPLPSEPNCISKSGLYRFLLQITWPGSRRVGFYIAIPLNGLVINSTWYLFPSQIICNTIWSVESHGSRDRAICTIARTRY